jgi:hypothetical protein
MGWHKGLGKMMGVYDEVRRALGRRFGRIVTTIAMGQLSALATRLIAPGFYNDVHRQNRRRFEVVENNASIRVITLATTQPYA